MRIRCTTDTPTIDGVAVRVGMWVRQTDGVDDRGPCGGAGRWARVGSVRSERASASGWTINGWDLGWYDEAAELEPA
jgi:hypothetical protein